MCKTVLIETDQITAIIIPDYSVVIVVVPLTVAFFHTLKSILGNEESEEPFWHSFILYCFSHF